MIPARAHTWIRLIALAAIIAAATYPRAAGRDRFAKHAGQPAPVADATPIAER